jgi:hypothetical protein
MSDDFITADQLQAVGKTWIEIDHGDLVVGRINFGHGPAAHAFLRVLAGRPDEVSTAAVLARLVAEQAEAPKLMPTDLAGRDDNEEGDVAAVLGAVIMAQTDAIADEIVEFFHGGHVHVAEQRVFVRAKLQQLADAVVGRPASR